MPEDRNCFVFRTDSSDFVQNELNAGRLRQGWSPQGTSLRDDAGQQRSKEEWSQAYRSAWDVCPSPRRYAILCRMLEMKEGDLILCPNAPEYGHFTIAEVSGDYQFKMVPSRDDFGHIVPVRNQREVSNWHNQDAQMLSDLFKSAYFRSAVVKIQDYKEEDVSCAATRLLRIEEDTKCGKSSDGIRKQRFDESRREAARFYMKNVRKWGFEQFEAAVGEAFRRKGYEWIRGKSARAGGDADHVFSLPMPGFEDGLLEYTSLLIVQVKHKDGIDEDDIEGVKQLIKWRPDEDEEVVHRVLFSSVDEFTDECKKCADGKVTLICGVDAGLFML